MNKIKEYLLNEREEAIDIVLKVLYTVAVLACGAMFANWFLTGLNAI